MQVFTKRFNDFSLFGNNTEEDFLTDALRLRLQEEIKFFVTKEKYLEPFLLVDNRRHHEFYLHASTLKKISLREIGMDITDLLKCDDTRFLTCKKRDFFLFDLIEILIVFSKDTHREEIVERFNIIFEEEGDLFMVHNFMIFPKYEMGIKSIIPLIKDKVLKDKLEKYDSLSKITDGKINYEEISRISADIVQLLFSSPKGKDDTKDYTEELCNSTAEKLTDSTKKVELGKLISETVKNAKNLNNQISNIRHTDRSTVPVDSPSIYKLIGSNNMQLAELIILSFPEEYMLKQEVSLIKENYLKKYSIDSSIGWQIKDKDMDDEISIEDVPF